MVNLTEEKSNNSEKEELLDKLRELENKIDSIKKNSLIDNEDQLFFGVIISLLILFITLPIGDLVLYLQSSFTLNYNDALNVAQTIRYLGIGAFLFSAFTRYYAVVGNQSNSRKYRYASLEGLMFAIAFILIVTLANLTLALSSLPRSIAVTISIISILSVLLLLNIVERKILDIYVSRALITKNDKIPLITSASIIFMSAIIVANVIQSLAMAFGASYGVLNIIFIITCAISAILFGLIYIYRWLPRVKPKV